MPTRFDPISGPLDGINLIEASAGTGKTWNICALYLRLLLERNLAVQQILVVTFTIAATAELRERIRARIAEAARHVQGVGEERDAFVVELIERLLDQPGHSRKDLAARLELALQTFDEASIFTIHGFCQRALSDTAFAAGLPFEFELMTDDNEIIVEAVNDFWRRNVACDGFARALASYMSAIKDSKRDTPQTWARLVARHMAKPLAHSIWPPELDASGHGVSNDEANAERLEAAYRAARAAWQTDRDAVIDCITKGMPSLNKGVYKTESIAKSALAWDRYFLTDDPISELGERNELFTARRLKDKTNKGGTTPHHSLCAQLDELVALRSSTRETLELARLRLIRSMLEQVGDDLPRRKRERRIIAFNDMLSNLYAALNDARYPWLAASLRQRFPAALIDEFQDTDPLQFAIFDAIYGKADSTLFLVGDPKQAIYSFRNADLYTYLDARRRAAGHFTLDQNQRSTPGLISAVNGLFGGNARAFMLDGLLYQAFAPGQRERDPLHDYSGPPSRADLRVWTLPLEQPLHRSEVRELASQATAAEVARLLSDADAGKIRIGDRPLRASDIAILVRSHAQGSEIKRELARLDVGSVELRQESVFGSIDADEVQRLLMAINEPSRVGLLRAALATEMIGCNAADIAALSLDEVRIQRTIEQYSSWRDSWATQGAGVMFRRLLADQGVSARLLRRPDGERRLTNLLHLGEELHKAAQVHDTPESLLRWFARQRRDQAAAEATQLRLESDQNLVQIATIHKAKGLEFPIVFCPFLWDGFLLPRRAGMDGREYHAFDGDDASAAGAAGAAGATATAGTAGAAGTAGTAGAAGAAGAAGTAGTAVVDYRIIEDRSALDIAIKQQIKLEDSAEVLRLAYVALTRAVYRCYLIAGTYTHVRTSPSTSQSCDSLLNWLVAGNGESPESWWQKERTPHDIAEAWEALAKSRHPHIGLVPLPMTPGTPLAIEQPEGESLVALEPPSHIANPWRLSSFSGLANGARTEAAAADHDERTAMPTTVRTVGLAPPDVAPDDILRFPRGTNAGDCLHAVLERIDFTDPSTWSDAIGRALSAHPQRDQRLSGPTSPGASLASIVAPMIARMLGDLMSTEILPGFRLDTLPRARRMTELEFNLSAGDVSPGWLNQLLAKSGYDVPRLAYPGLEGYLKGFIDCVFEHDGRYWVLDWKSNHLGFAARDYDRAGLEATMAEHAYHLQHLIYTLALHRYLSHRMSAYRYDAHFGGVLYLFVRGVRPQWKNADGSPSGVFHHRPNADVIASLDRMLGVKQRKSA